MPQFITGSIYAKRKMGKQQRRHANTFHVLLQDEHALLLIEDQQVIRGLCK